MSSCKSGQVVEFRFALRATCSTRSFSCHASSPREQRINDRAEDDQIDKSGRSNCGERRPSTFVGKETLGNKKRPGVEVKECSDHPGWRMTRPIEPVDQHQ